MKAISYKGQDNHVIGRYLIPSTRLSVFGCNDCAQIIGGIVQIGLGILIGFSSLQRLEYLKCFSLHFPFDDVSILLVSMAVIVTAAPFPVKPKMEIPSNRMLKWLFFTGLSWYAVFSAFSYAHFHRGILWESADKHQIIAAIALSVLPIALLIIILSRHTYRCAIPSWSMALLAFGLFMLPFNMQLGQLPICVLSFTIAFISTFLARGTKVLLLSATAANLLLLALSMADYVIFLPAVTINLPRFGNALAGASYTGHYLILMIAVSVALLFSRPISSSRVPIYIITGFLILCLALTQTRGAVIGLLSGVFFFFFQQKKRHRISKTTVVVLVFFAVASVFMITHLTAERQAGEERPELLMWALQEFTYSPLIGNGIGSWHSTYTEHAMAEGITSDIHQHCHNILSEILCSMGLLGLLIFGIVLYFGSRLYLRARDILSSTDVLNAIIVLTAGIFGYIVSLVVNVVFWYQAVMPAVPVLVGVCMGYVAFESSSSIADMPITNLKRCTYPLLLVIGVMLVSLIATSYLPTYYSTYMNKLSHKWFGSADAGELPFGDIRGRVIDHQGRSMEDVTVILDQPRRYCFTDKDGAFAFTNIQKRSVGHEHLMKFYRKGYIKKIAKIEQIEHGPTIIGIELDRYGSSQ